MTAQMVLIAVGMECLQLGRREMERERWSDEATSWQVGRRAAGEGLPSAPVIDG